MYSKTLKMIEGNELFFNEFLNHLIDLKDKNGF